MESLKAFRKKKKLTQQALAMALSKEGHFTTTEITKYERDVYEPSVRFIIAFAKTFPEETNEVFKSWLGAGLKIDYQTEEPDKLPTYQISEKILKSGIARFRIQQGLTQEEFCRELKKVGYTISSQFLSKMENGKPPSKDFIKAMVRRYDVDLVRILIN